MAVSLKPDRGAAFGSLNRARGRWCHSQPRDLRAGSVAVGAVTAPGDAVNSSRVLAGVFTSSDVLSRREVWRYACSGRFRERVRFPAAPQQQARATGPGLFCVSSRSKRRSRCRIATSAGLEPASQALMDQCCILEVRRLAVTGGLANPAMLYGREIRT